MLASQLTHRRDVNTLSLGNKQRVECRRVDSPAVALMLRVAVIAKCALAIVVVVVVVIAAALAVVVKLGAG